MVTIKNAAITSDNALINNRFKWFAGMLCPDTFHHVISEGHGRLFRFHF